jgi:hypothetical protein
MQTDAGKSGGTVESLLIEHARLDKMQGQMARFTYAALAQFAGLIKTERLKKRMDLSKIRRIFLWVFIAFLSLTALIAIFTVLGGAFGKTVDKVLATTFTISAASICAMACAAFVEKKANPIGTVGIISAGITALVTIIEIWGEINSSGYWKLTGSLIVISIALAHSSLLLIPNLAANHRWTQILAVVFIALLALLLIVVIYSETSDESFYRFIGVVSIIVVLMTLIIPIYSKLGGKLNQTPTFDRLILTKISDNLYADQSGKKFQVTEIETEKL